VKSSQRMEDMPTQGKKKTQLKGKAGVPPGTTPAKRGRPRKK
jgi:hypothetical protein